MASSDSRRDRGLGGWPPGHLIHRKCAPSMIAYCDGSCLEPKQKLMSGTPPAACGHTARYWPRIWLQDSQPVARFAG